ncbi:MFS transporter [Bacillus cytotoxicus]|uniref:MFS transporter n=1 Tax=Bacillus cytotoxicus TaxID=580165 RepID=UPI003D7D6880
MEYGGGTGAVSTAVVSRMIGSIVFAPLVNIFGSRKIIICTDLLRGFVMLAFWLLAILGSQNVILLSLLVGLNMFFAGGFEAALQSFIPTISDELRKANADLSTGRNFVQLIGLLSGGILMEMYFGLGFLINAVTFLLASLVAIFLKVEDLKTGLSSDSKVFRQFFHKLKQDFRKARKAIVESRPLRLAFVSTFFVSTLSFPMGTLIAPLVQETAGGNSILFSIIESSIVIGGLVGAFLMKKSKNNDSTFILLGSLLCGLSMLIVAIGSHSIILIVSMTVFGFASTIFNIAEYTIIQSSAESLRAPIFSILQFTSTCLYPVLSILSAMIVNLFNVKILFLIGGFLITLLFLVIIFNKKTVRVSKNVLSEKEKI